MTALPSTGTGSAASGIGGNAALLGGVAVVALMGALAATWRSGLARR